MKVKRPDLANINPAIRAYIENLEARVAELESQSNQPNIEIGSTIDLNKERPHIPSVEPPTTICAVCFTSGFVAKRTKLHLYTRQKRGGMGVFDMITSETDPPALITVADINHNLLLFTSMGRAFRLPVSQILETEVRGRGETIAKKIPLFDQETLVSVLVDEAKGAVALVTEYGMVRLLRHHVFGEYMKPGTTIVPANKFGKLRAACRTQGDSDLFIMTKKGQAIRFPEKLIPPKGCEGIKLLETDLPTAIASVKDESSVLLMDANGYGTVRLMSGFAANKSPGGSGKIAMKSNNCVSALCLDGNEDVFVLSRLSKVIRFQTDEIPAKEAAVQGVTCMSLRSDEVVSAILC